MDQSNKSTSKTMDLERLLEQNASIWVFGYGSLTWKPDFSYNRKEIGFIKGFKRRFWQGNVTHRGTKERVGRVATLIPVKKGNVWGVAYEIKGNDAIKKAFGGLTTREITLGGYDVRQTSFYPRDNRKSGTNVIVYMATKDNSLFLGKADMDRMATEIALANGPTGSNTEYVTRLADYIRKHIPEEHDEHLFALDKKVREIERLNFNNSLNSVLDLSETIERHLNITDKTNSNINDAKIENMKSHKHIPLIPLNPHHHHLTINK